MPKKNTHDISCALCGRLCYDAKSGTIVNNFRTDTFGEKKQSRCNACIGLEQRAKKESKT